ncbi:MAG: hypothetical protein CTY28_09600 [Hyphomicrobium sp.]|nr:MAG: hypothetical protein CTY28_09600 [Hyphomicrobium sp.]
MTERIIFPEVGPASPREKCIAFLIEKRVPPLEICAALACGPEVLRAFAAKWAEPRGEPHAYQLHAVTLRHILNGKGQHFPALFSLESLES